MIDGNSPILERWRLLAPRERTLLQLLLIIIAALAVVYVGILPGLNAANSAQNRKDRATLNLAEVQVLAHQVNAYKTKSEATSLDLAQSATETSARDQGFEVTTAQQPTGLQLQITATTSAQILEWISGMSEDIAMGIQTIDLQPTTDGVHATILLTRLP